MGLPVAKGAGPDEALARGAEAAARSGHDVALLQDLRKHVPGGLAGEADPDVGGVLSSIHREAQIDKGLAQDGRILSVECHQLDHFPEALVLQSGIISQGVSRQQA